MDEQEEEEQLKDMSSISVHGEHVTIVNEPKRCLIINFQQADHKRESSSDAFTDADLEIIKIVFKETFKFAIYEKNVEDIGTLESILEEEAEEKYEFLVIFLITNENFTYSIDNLLDFFAYKISDGRKPKFLFLLGPEIKNLRVSKKSRKIFQESTSYQSNDASYADLVLFYSKQVSSTILSICSILMKNVFKNYDFITLLKMVAHKLKNIQNEPIIMSTLTKSVFLGYNCDDDKQLQYFYPDFQYPISNGLCVIYHFKRIGTKIREQTEYNINLLKSTFSGLNYDITEHIDWSKEQIVTNLGNDFSEVDCLVLCFASQGLSGQIICSDQARLTIKELVYQLRENKSLNGKPKLLLVHTSQMLDPNQCDQSFHFEISQDMFIFYGAFTEQVVYYTSHKGGWFINALCDAIINNDKKDLLDIEAIAAKVANTIEKNFEDNANLAQRTCHANSQDYASANSSSNNIYQNPYYVSTLTRPLFIREIMPDKRKRPLRGRCVILNYEECHTFNTTHLAASFVDIDFYCKTYYKPDYLKTIEILQKESHNEAKTFSCFVMCIYANCYNQGFECYNKNSSKYIGFEEVLSYFQNGPMKQMPIYIYINANSLKSCHLSTFSHLQLENITLSYNSHYPVNSVMRTLMDINWPISKEKILEEMSNNCTSQLQSVPENSNQFCKLKLTCLTNTIGSFDILSTDTNLDREVRIQDRTKQNRCLVLNLNDKFSRADKVKRLITTSLIKTFKDGLHFDVQVETCDASISNWIEIVQNREIENFKNYNCFILFIFGTCSTDENNLIKSLIKNCPKSSKMIMLIFIQNLSNNNLEEFNQFGNHKNNRDLLVVSIANDLTFIPILCRFLDKHSSEYDLMSLIHMSNEATPLTRTKSILLTSTLTKMLFFNKPEAISNIEFIKSDRQFYQKAKTEGGKIGKCIILSNGHFSNDIEQVAKTFKKLNFNILQRNNSNVNWHQTLMENDVIQNCNCICIFVLMDAKSDAVIVKQLIEDLSNVKSLLGKPKLIFLHGSFELLSNHYLENNFAYSTNSASSFRIPKYADFMLFQCKYLSHSIKTLCNHIEKYADKLDLISLLTMVIRDMDQHLSTEPNSSSQLEPIGASINSTLTRMFSFGIFDTKVAEELKCANSYKLPMENRGKCVIFNYEKFSSRELKERKGTQNDGKCLRETFELLNFNVETHNDLTREETKLEIDQIDCSGFHCLVVCFLTHGNENELHCFDGSIRRDDIINSIVPNKTLTNGMPKILIFQACRGEKIDHGTAFEDIETDIINPIGSPLSKYPDLFVLCSSNEGYLSFRHPDSGSLLIQKLCRVLKENYKNRDFVNMVTMVCREVSQINEALRFENENRIVKQMPIFYSTFKKTLSFVLEN